MVLRAGRIAMDEPAADLDAQTVLAEVRGS
jgi:hypothetical protein